MEKLYFKAIYKVAFQLVAILLFSASTQAEHINPKDSNIVTPVIAKQSTNPAVVTKEIKVH